MKNMWKMVGLAGIAVLVYAVIGRFVGSNTIGAGIVGIHAASGILIADSLLLVAILLRLWEK